jgi:hypothetical protein
MNKILWIAQYCKLGDGEHLRFHPTNLTHKYVGSPQNKRE